MRQKNNATSCVKCYGHFLLIASALIFLVFLPVAISAQTDTISTIDTIRELPEIKKVKRGSIFSGRPGKALLMSLVIPGAGQVYNKSYLRVPFVWAAVGGVGYLMISNTQQYNCFRDTYIAKIDGDFEYTMLPAYCQRKTIPLTNIAAADLQNASPEVIRELRDQANVNRQWSIVGFAVVWLLNGVDAFVDAHLKEFDIDEDLSIDIGPRMTNDSFAPMKMGIFVKF